MQTSLVRTCTFIQSPHFHLTSPLTSGSLQPLSSCQILRSWCNLSRFMISIWKLAFRHNEEHYQAVLKWQDFIWLKKKKQSAKYRVCVTTMSGGKWCSVKRTDSSAVSPATPVASRPVLLPLAPAVRVSPPPPPKVLWVSLKQCFGEELPIKWLHQGYSW